MKVRELDGLLAVAVQRGVIDERVSDELRALAHDGAAPPDPPPSLEDEAGRLREARRREEEARFAADQEALRAARDRHAALERQRRQALARARAAEVGAVAALIAPADDENDDEAGGALLPLVYENIGWLVGAALVLAGSVYGLREAWVSFDAAGRWATVAAGLFGYHALFVMVSAVLARRSARAGQFLAGLGACLVPLAYVAVANLSAARPIYGLAAGGVLAVAGLGTLANVGRRFDVGYRLAPALLAPAATLAAYPHLASESPWRFALPIVALAAPWLTVRSDRTRGSLGVFTLSLFAALVSEIFALSSNAAGEGAETPLGWRTGGPAFGAWLGVYLAVLGSVLFAARAIQPASEMKRRALAAAVWLGFALAVGAGALAALAALQTSTAGPGPTAVAASFGAALVAAWQARALARQRPAAFHVLLVLASLAAAVACRLALPALDARPWWALAALAPPLVHLGRGRRLPAPERASQVAAVWATVLVLVLWSCEVARDGTYPLTLAAGLAVAAGCHRQRDTTWHLAGALVAALAVTTSTFGAPDPRTPGYAQGALAVTYGAAALLTARAREPGAASPLDDASSLLFAAAALAGLRAVTWAPAFLWQPGVGVRVASDVLPSIGPLLAASAGLLLRSLADHSALPSAAGALGLAFAGLAVTGAATAGAVTLVLGWLALAAGLVAAALTPKMRTPALGRALLGRFELPWSWSGAGAVGQGFGAAMFLLGLLASLANLAWFAVITVDRTLAIAGGLGVALACLVVFFTRAANNWALRGRPGVLWALGVAVALVAVTNRIGRPLPPGVVARNLTLIGIALWLAARAGVRAGPWLADRLAAPAAAGRRYHLVPHAGVLALGAVLVVDAWVLGPLPLFRGLAVVPPLMLLGPAVLALLLGRSGGARSTFWIAAPLLVAGAALIGAQGHLSGPLLTPLVPPGGGWVPAGTAFLLGDPQAPARYGGQAAILGAYRGALTGIGTAAALLGGLAFAVERRRSLGERLTSWLWRAPDREAQDRLVAWMTRATVLGTLLVCVCAAWVSAPAAALLTLAAAVVVARPARTVRVLVAPVLAAALVIHAQAQAMPAVAAWPGALLGALALVVSVAAHLTLARTRERKHHLVLGHAMTSAFVVLGASYGFAFPALNAELAEGWAVIGNAITGVGAWGRTWVPAAPLALGAASLFTAAASWNALVRRAPTRNCLAAAAALAVWAFATVVVWALGAVGPERLLLIAFAAAVVALGLHGAGVLLGERFDDLVHGSRLVRDGLFVVAGALLALAAGLAPFPVSPPTPLLALASLAVILGASFHALVVERKPRHVYFVEGALLGSYGFLRATWFRAVQPAEDAIVLLSLDFLLIGVTALARRRGVDTVATATRRFAALLPLVVAIVLPWQATHQNALFSLGASLFYGMLGWVERNRILGTLGAVTANLALLVLSLSEGLTGFDVYLAPLGLCTLLVVHLFRDGMSRDTALALRAAGAALGYAPAALTLVLQVGNAQSDYYPLGFAVACLAGIVAGMWFHIRAYLALGLGFLLLDLGTLLVRASLRNQRLGFFVLSLAGLAILSAMVFYTLNRERVRRALGRLQRALGTWD